MPCPHPCSHACNQTGRGAGAGPGRGSSLHSLQPLPARGTHRPVGVCVPLQPGVRTSRWSGTRSQCEPAWQAHGGFIPIGPRAAANGCSQWLSQPSPRAQGGSSTRLPRPQDQEWRECSGGTWAPVTQRSGEAKTAGVLCPSLFCLPWWARRLAGALLLGPGWPQSLQGFLPPALGGASTLSQVVPTNAWVSCSS